MTVDKNRAEVVAKARAALGDDGFRGELRVRGSGEVRGVPVSWARTIHAGGALRETVEGALGHAVGFDGERGWRVDPSGMPGPLELGDLEELVVASAVWSGRWARPDGGVLIEDVGEGAHAAGGGGVVLGLRAGARGARRYRLTLDGRTYLPRRLEQVGRDDTALELEDFRPGGFGRIPYVARSRQAWLVDTLRVEAVERVVEGAAEGAAEPSSYALNVRAPDDLDFAEGAAPPAWRRTRGKLPLVRARVDELDAGWFALDTGAGALALAEEVAAKLSLPELGRSLVRTSDGVVGAPYRTARTLQVGGATLRAPRFLELDLAAFSAAAGVKLAGILGYDLFMRAAVTIDVEAGVAIAPSATLAASGGGDGAKGEGDEGEGDGGDSGGRWLALQLEDGCPVVPARFPGPQGEQAGLITLDTGSAAAVTFVAGAAPLVEMRRRGRVSVRGASGTASARAGELAWLELAGHRLDEVAALISRPGAGAGGDPTPAPAVLGSLGMAVLRDFELTLDYPRRRIRLRRRRRAALRALPR